MLCDFKDGKCDRCGVARQPPYPKRRCTPGLGDIVAAALSTVGITKDRAQAVANAIGLDDCGCGKRQESLTQLGYRLGIGTPPPAAPENQGEG